MTKIDQAGLDEWDEAQLHGRRITSWIRENTRTADCRPIDLGQAVNRFGNEFRGLMRHPIPLLPLGDVANTKIGRQIDHANPRIDQRASLLHRNTVGRGEEYDIARFEIGVLRCDELQPNPAANSSPTRPRRLGNIAATGVPASPREVIATSCTAGCPASSRNSSTPV